MILEQLQEHRGTQLGWITGLKWSRLQVIDYKAYSQVLHGALPKELIPIIFRKLKISRAFKEHLWVDIFRFFILTVLIISIIFLFLGVIMLHRTSIAIAILLFSLGLFLKAFEECVGCCGSLRLKKRIRDLIVELNQELEPVGIVLRFPVRSRRICFVFQWNMCKAVEYETLEIWTVNDEMQPIINSQNIRRNSSMESEKHQKLNEDETVYV